MFNVHALRGIQTETRREAVFYISPAKRRCLLTPRVPGVRAQTLSHVRRLWQHPSQLQSPLEEFSQARSSHSCSSVWEHRHPLQPCCICKLLVHIPWHTSLIIPTHQFLCIYSSMDGHRGCFYLLAIINYTAWNTCV